LRSPHRTARFATAVIAAGLVLATVAGCASGSQHHGLSSSQQASQARFTTAPALLVQCAINHGVTAVDGDRPLDSSTALVGSTEQYVKDHPGIEQWLHGTRIELTGKNASGFTDWFDYPPNLIVDSKGLFIGGKDLFSDWPMTAAAQDRLPSAVCGPGVSARQLYNQVYANWPTRREADPWQT
jgi:hypothetical protein